MERRESVERPNPFGIGSAENDANMHNFERGKEDRLHCHHGRNFNQDMSLDSGLSVCDLDEGDRHSVDLSPEQQSKEKSMAKRNIDFLIDVVNDKLGDQDRDRDSDSEYAYVPKADLQLAAELGKTLLERNQELEETVRRLQAIIEDQSREIEYLTKQACQLRDANEARLRIYETLEQSVGELERNNRQLQDVTKGDKKRIKALCASLELVEQHCEELQEAVDTIKATSHATQLTQQAIVSRKSKTQSDYTSSEESNTDEDSGIHGSDESDFAGFEDTPLELQEVLRLRSDLVRLRSQICREQRVRESLSCELERSVQENARLREELLSSRERERQSLNLQMEIGGVHNLDLASKQCSNCRLMEGPEEELCELDSGMNSGAEAETGEEENTLLYELDMQYRVLIEKYEALLEARRKDFDEHDAMTMSQTSQNFESGFGSGSDNGSPSPPSPPTSRDAGCQTEILVLKKRASVEPVMSTQPRSSSRLPAPGPAIVTNVVAPSVPSAAKVGACLVKLSEADQETFNKHFEHSPPEYKKLFAEIFAVLKRKVAEMPTCSATKNSSAQSPPAVLPDLGSRLECNLEKLKATVPHHVRFTRSYAEVVRNRQQQQQQVQAIQAGAAFTKRFAN